MPLDSDDSTRCLRRNWNQNKSHLPKYSSLPEFQLVMKESSSYYHCRQCGFTFTGSVINPVCLWCAWTCDKAQQHEFASSGPRARRASAPSIVFIKIDLSPWKFTLTGDHANIDSAVIDPLPIVSSQSPYIPVDQTSIDASAMDMHRNRINIDTNMVNDDAHQREVHPVPETLCDVATVTRSVWGKNLLQNSNKSNPSLSFDQSSTSSLSFAQSTIKRVEHNSEHNSAMGLKFLQRTFGRTDKTLHPGDAYEHENVSRRRDDCDELTPTPIKSAHPHSPKPLRRKKHLHVMHCAPDPDPIAFSLTLHHSSPPTSSQVSKKTSQKLRHSHTSTRAHPQYNSSGPSGTGNPVTPPMTPTYQRSSPPPRTRSPSPVPFGHPSRPYYTAIRKYWTSPPTAPPTPSRSRPQSQPPPPSFHLGLSAEAPMTPTATMTDAYRHLSMSAMPPTYGAYGGYDNGDFGVHPGPTNSARLSLSPSHHRQSYDNRTQTHTRNAQSLSRATNGMFSSRGIGFSMSGEAELRMALAASSPPGVASGVATTFEDEFRFRETIPSQNMNTGYPHTRHVGSMDSFMGRVKKLRKALKEMLMN